MEKKLVNITVVVAAVVITLLQRLPTTISHPRTTQVRLTASKSVSQEGHLEQAEVFLSK